MHELFKRIYLAFRPSNRVVVMDYAIEPTAVYTPENPHQKLLEIVSANDEAYGELLRDAWTLRNNFFTIVDASVEKDQTQPTWNNNYVPGLDIIILYTMLVKLKPKKYIEIGSGTTTKTAAKVRKEQALDFTITCIDPNPRQEIKEIADQWHASLIQQYPVEEFVRLSENDVVFFDGTHTLFPNSDVMWFFLEILPVLPKGVVVQVHDIYIPYDYPQFMLDRYYSENYLLGALILNNPGKFEILSPNFYISEHETLPGMLNDVWSHPSMKNVETHGGSFWFRVR